MEMPSYIVAIAKPGDTILIGYNGPLSEDDIEALDASFEPLMVAGIQVGFTDNVAAMVILRGATDA